MASRPQETVALERIVWATSSFTSTPEAEQVGIGAAIQDLIDRDMNLIAKVTLLRTITSVRSKNLLPVLVMLTSWDLLYGDQGTVKILIAHAGLDL